MLIVRSPVRISFGGGGTDLPAYYERFGGTVLSTSINKYFYTILQKRTDGKIQVISSDLRVMETWQDISRMEIKHSELGIPLAAIKERLTLTFRSPSTSSRNRRSTSLATFWANRLGNRMNTLRRLGG